MKIKIDKSKSSKTILMISIILLIIYSTISLFFFSIGSFVLFLFPVFGSADVIDSLESLLLFFVLFVIALFYFAYLYKKAKYEYINPIEADNKCIKCNHEMSNIKHKCPNCGFESDVEYTCNRCLAINNINSSACLKCGEDITKEDKIYQINKKITLNILEAILIILIVYRLFGGINEMCGIIISALVIYYHYLKLKKLFNVLKYIKE